MPPRGEPQVAVLAQQLDDHLVDCVRERQATNRRLGRIEALVWAVGSAIILQLVSACAFLFVKAYG